MAAFPGAVATFTGFTSTHTLATDNHAAQHNLEQAEIVAAQTKVGTGASTPTNNTVLLGNGVGTSAWGAVPLTTHVSGILPLANGGLGQNTLANLPLVSPVITSGGSWAGSPTISTPTLTTPVINDFSSATHTHVSNSQGGQLNGADAISDGTLTPAELVAGTGSSWVWTTFAPTATGYSATTILAGRYKQIGKNITYTFKVSGTSNAITATLTLPVTAKNTANILFESTTLGVVDNSAGIAAPGRALIDASADATIVNLYKESGGTAWTNSGTKACGGTIEYEAA